MADKEGLANNHSACASGFPCMLFHGSDLREALSSPCVRHGYVVAIALSLLHMPVLFSSPLMIKHGRSTVEGSLLGTGGE